MSNIIPAIIPDSLGDLAEHLLMVRGAVGRVQVDVMNGTYAPGRSWPYDSENHDFHAIVREEDGLPYWQDFDFEIDLLIREPEKHLAEWMVAGAACCIVHMETTDELPTILREGSDRRLELAVAVTPGADVALLAPYVEQLVFVQVMGNAKVGYHGVSLDPRALDTIRALHEQYPTLTIGVDIGVSEETLPSLIAAGATRFASGSAVFRSGNPKRALKELEALLRTLTNGA